MTFDFEKMKVFRLSLTAIDRCIDIIGDMPRGNSGLADQLRRAISSVALNISEGSGEFKPKEKARFYRMALRSVSESCSIVQIGYRLKIVNKERYDSTYQLLTIIAKMLTKLVASMDQRNASLPRIGIGIGSGD